MGFLKYTKNHKLSGYFASILRPYALLARWDRPIGTWLLLLPCWCGLALAQIYRPIPLRVFFSYMALLAAGAIILRGAGCTINDMMDYKLDAKVARTADRPLASRIITHGKASLFLILQFMMGAFILSLLPRHSWFIALAIMPLVVLYPLAKRFIWYPQAILGLAFNWGVWVGYSIIMGMPLGYGIDKKFDADWFIVPFILYSACWAWTMAYDTIYAHQDKRDDYKIGVKSTALRFSPHDRIAIASFYGLMMVFLLGLGYFLPSAFYFYWISIVLIGGQMIWHLNELEFDESENCHYFFVKNRYIGLCLCAGLMLDRLIMR